MLEPDMRRRTYRVAHRLGPSPAHPNRRALWIMMSACAVVVVVGVVAAGLIFYGQVQSVREDLLGAKDRLAQVAQVGAGLDGEAIDLAIEDVKGRIDRADETVSNPLWDAAARIPIVGPNVAAVQSVTQTAHELTQDVMPVAMQLLSAVQGDGLTRQDGGINLDPLKETLSALPDVQHAFDDAAASIAAIDREGILPEVAGPIDELSNLMTDAAPALETAQRLLPELLSIAGADEPRTYLVLFQNNAEIRATGGNPATSVIVHVDDGRVTLGQQTDSWDFWLTARSSYPLPDEMLSLYEWNTTRDLQNFNRTPDFPTTAQMFRSMWADARGTSIDGVISVDPVVLSYMLSVTGPVTLDDGTQITAENAVQSLLSDAYARFPDKDASDDYFAEVTTKTFDTAASGKWNPVAMFDALKRGAAEQRVYAWFAQPGEEGVAIELGVDGALSQDTSDETELGVFLVDSSIGKLEYFLSTSVNVTCDAPSREVMTTITLNNTIPGDDYVPYVLGARSARQGYPATTMLLDVLYFSPPGAPLVGSAPATGDIGAWDRQGVEKGREAMSITVAVGKAESRQVSFTSKLPQGELGPLSVRYSPTVTQTPVSIDESCAELTSAP